VPEIDWSRGIVWTLTSDPFMLHFVHRWWAWVAVAALVWLARQVRQTDRFAAIAVNAAFGTMVLLGIATVMSGVRLIALGAALATPDGGGRANHRDADNGRARLVSVSRC
jgi:heme A synthase